MTERELNPRWTQAFVEKLAMEVMEDEPTNKMNNAKKPEEVYTASLDEYLDAGFTMEEALRLAESDAAEAFNQAS
jgi:hypothetical protein